MAEIVIELPTDDPADIIARDTRMLLPQIAERVDHDAHLLKGEGVDGERSGGGSILGRIAVNLATGEALGSLLDVVGNFFARKRGGKITARRADGASIEIDRDDLSDEQYDATLERFMAFAAAPVAARPAGSG